MGIFVIVGIVNYVVVVVAMAILALDWWQRGAPRGMVLLLILWGVISLLQLYGLVAIQSGNTDPTVWFVNRGFWFALAVVALSQAWRAFCGWIHRLIDDHVDRLL